MFFFVMNGPCKVYLYFLVGNYTWCMCFKLFCGNNRFQIFTDSSARFALYCFDKQSAVHVWPPAVLSHTYHPPATRLTCMEIVNKGLFECIGNCHLLVHADTPACHVKVPPITVKVCVEGLQSFFIPPNYAVSHFFSDCILTCQ